MPDTDTRSNRLASLLLTCAFAICIAARADAQTSRCPDADGDGHRCWSCGGDDCDDSDASRFPGRADVCDGSAHDEDCDPLTYGSRDEDLDGEDDRTCCNEDPGAPGGFRCGSDDDDHNAAIRRGAMTCDGAGSVHVSGVGSRPCPSGTSCVTQPNGTGLCMLPPPGYAAPPPFSAPGPPVARGTNRTGSLPCDGGPSPLTLAPSIGAALAASASSPGAEVASCRSILESGTVSWGGGTTWDPTNIERLCRGTTDARQTIDCFRRGLATMNWQDAIEACRAR